MTNVAEQAWLLDAKGGQVVEFFAELGIVVTNKVGAEAAVSCFANPGGHNRDDRKPSCSVNLITGLWHCQACGEKGNAFQAAQLSRNDVDSARLAQRYGLFLSVEKAEKVRMPTERKVKEWKTALRSSPTILARLFEVKAWTPEAIYRLGLGWDGERVTFTIRNPKLKIVGIVRYLPGGTPKSLALPGSKREFFPAPEIIHRRHPMFLVEGEGDAVAMWSIGLKAVAIPGAGSWKPDWAKRLLGRQVIALTDCDRQGRGLGRRIAQDLPSAQVIDLEPGREDGWDVGNLIHEASLEGGVWQARKWLGAL